MPDGRLQTPEGQEYTFFASESGGSSSSSDGSGSYGSDEGNGARTKSDMMIGSQDSDGDAISEECFKVKADKS